MNQAANSQCMVELSQIPNLGDQMEMADGTLLHVIQVIHAPWSREVVARIVVAHRNAMGFFGELQVE